MADEASCAFDEYDRTYRDLPSGPLSARIYRPRLDRRLPCVVEVHGGGWTSGNRLSDAALNQSLARAGIIVVAVDFRKPPEGRFPASVVDVNHAIRWVKDRAAELGADETRIGGLGTSSGGHQILLNALCPEAEAYACRADNTRADASLAFVVACWPVADPSARYEMARRENKAFLVEAHDTYWPSIDDMRTGNPQRIVEEALFSHMPPLLLIQGTADENLTQDMAGNFADSYARRGGEVELVRYDGESHAFITRASETDASRQAMDTIARFIRRDRSRSEGARK